MAIRKVSAGAIGSGSITADKLATDSVTTAKVVALNITSAKLGTGSVEAANLNTGSVTTAKLADLGVTSTKLGTGAVTADRILDGAVTTAKIADAHVTTAKITDLNVTTGKIATGAVTTSKVAALAIDSTLLGTSAVTTVKIADLNVTSAKLATGAVGSSQLATGAVGTNQLATGGVTLTRLASAAPTSVLGNTGGSTGSVAAISFTELSTYVAVPTIVAGGNLDIINPAGTAAPEDLFTITLPANSISSAGEFVEFDIRAVLDGTTGTPQLAVTFDATPLTDLSTFTLPANGMSVGITGKIFYYSVGSYTLDVVTTVHDSIAGTSVTLPYSSGGSFGSADFTTALDLVVSGMAPENVAEVDLRTVMLRVIK